MPLQHIALHDALTTLQAFRALQCKLDAIKTYGGDITLCEATLDAREATCARIQERTGAVLIPPFNYGPVMSGQVSLSLCIGQPRSPYISQHQRVFCFSLCVTSTACLSSKRQYPGAGGSSFNEGT